MQLALRLYYPIDADLIAIRLRERRKFTYLVRDKLARLLDSSQTTMTEQDIYQIPKNIKKYVRAIKEPMKVNLNLKDGRDDIIIHYLKQVQPSMRCDTVKFLFRMCLESYPEDIFPRDLFLNFKKSMIPQADAPIISSADQEEYKTKDKRKTQTGIKSNKKKQHNKSRPEKNDNHMEENPTPLSNQNPEKISIIPENSTDNEQIIIKEAPSGRHQAAPAKEGNSVSSKPADSVDEDDNAAYEMFSNLLGY